MPNGLIVAYYKRRDGSHRPLYSWRVAEKVYARNPERITWSVEALLITGRDHLLSRDALAAE